MSECEHFMGDQWGRKRRLRIVVAGCRWLGDNHYPRLRRILEDIQDRLLAAGCEWDECVSGGARGGDAIGEAYAASKGIRVKLFPADWGRYGKAAGPKRNAQMADYGHGLIAIWDGHSRGTENMIGQMRDRKKPVYIIKIEGEK